MKTKFLCLLPIIALAACNNTVEPKEEKTIYHILGKEKSSYIEWFFSDIESIIPYHYKTYPTNVEGVQHVSTRSMEDNTFVLKNDNKVRLHDEYSLDYGDNTTTLSLTRTAQVVTNHQAAPSRYLEGEDVASTTNTYTYTLQTARPIELIRPAIQECNAIPMCYYENFEIEWTPDYDNENGVVIVAEWTGVTISEPMQSVSVVGVDVVDDTGLAILDTDIFTDMPDGALVNMWLIRGNLITITGDGGDVNLQDIQESSPEVLYLLLSQHPELPLQMQPYVFGSAAVTTFSFFLIREL